MSVKRWFVRLYVDGITVVITDWCTIFSGKRYGDCFGYLENVASENRICILVNLCCGSISGDSWGNIIALVCEFTMDILIEKYSLSCLGS